MIRKLGLLVFVVLSSLIVAAQSADGLPHGKPDPVEWSLFNVILLIVLPLLLIFYYLWYQNRKNEK